MRNASILILTAATASLLTACGGGGGTPPPPPPPPPPPSYAVASAFGHLLNSGGSWTVSGTGSDKVAYTLTFGFAPMAAAPFPIGGTVAQRSVLTISNQSAGTALSDASETYYFDAASLAFVGIVNDDGSCSVMTSSTPLPSSIVLGAAGPLYSESDLTDCTAGSTVDGTITGSWSIEADGSVVLLCWNVATPSAPATTIASLSYCVETATDGTLGTKARFNVNVTGMFALTARNF